MIQTWWRTTCGPPAETSIGNARSGQRAGISLEVGGVFPGAGELTIQNCQELLTLPVLCLLS